MFAFFVVAIALFAHFDFSVQGQRGGPVPVLSQPNNNYYHVNRRVQCPVINCPQWCPRWTGRDGCVYCGPCNPVNYQQRCPPVKCPAHLKCTVAIGGNGCKQCFCQPPSRQQVFLGSCPTPQCSQNCQLVKGPDGCNHCRCYPRTDCPMMTCPQNCRRYNGSDGCPDCDCGTTASCPEVPCNLNICRHIVDQRSGCAVSCQCLNGNNGNSIPRWREP